MEGPGDMEGVQSSALDQLVLLSDDFDRLWHVLGEVTSAPHTITEHPLSSPSHLTLQIASVILLAVKEGLLQSS
jgi:hypothetical protein